jgi:hypothetical protein
LAGARLGVLRFADGIFKPQFPKMVCL